MPDTPPEESKMTHFPPRKRNKGQASALGLLPHSSQEAQSTCLQLLRTEAQDHPSHWGQPHFL